jgi:hypothetical protein
MKHIRPYRLFESDEPDPEDFELLWKAGLIPDPNVVRWMRGFVNRLETALEESQYDYSVSSSVDENPCIGRLEVRYVNVIEDDKFYSLSWVSRPTIRLSYLVSYQFQVDDSALANYVTTHDDPFFKSLTAIERCTLTVTVDEFPDFIHEDSVENEHPVGSLGDVEEEGFVKDFDWTVSTLIDELDLTNMLGGTTNPLRELLDNYAADLEEEDDEDDADLEEEDDEDDHLR